MEPAVPAPCPRCGKRPALCVCDRLVSLATRTSVLVLQHPQESDEDLGTAGLLARMLPRAQVVVGLSWASLGHALGREVTPAGWGVLYPSSLPRALDPAEAARPFLVLSRSGEVLDPPPVLAGIVALDGTWSQAKALWWRNPWLPRLRRVLIHPTQPSIYGRMRLQPRREWLSTLEAVAEALVGNGEDPQVRAHLHRVFRTMLQRARDASGQAAHRRRRR